MAVYFQLKSFGWSLVIGMLGGWLYDLYRVSFRLLKLRSQATTVLGDALFWLFFTSLACVLILLISGEARFYTLLGMAVGFLIYHRFFRRRMVVFETCVGAALLRCLCFFKRLLLTPFHLFRNWLRVLQRHRVRR